MKKYRNKIILGVIVVAVLSIAFFWGGSGGGRENDAAAVLPGMDTAPVESVTPGNSSAQQGSGISSDDTTDDKLTIETDTPEHKTPREAADTPPAPEHITPLKTGDTPAPGHKTPQEETHQAHEQEQHQTPADISAESQNPAETAGTEPDDGEFSCVITISCKTVLDNTDKLSDEKKELIPADGIIFSGTAVFYEGESVFNVLQRELKRNRIHLEFVNAPVYNSAYIEGIGNLYEFDCGERSGWMYSVNGVFPSYGSSRYILSDGDEISWLFTCDRGNDIGGGDAADSYVKE